MNSIGPEEFFKQVALNSGVSDLQIARDVFYGLIRTISRELKQKHVIKLPDWGEFTLKVHKSRKFINVNDGEQGVLPPKPTIKFIPDWKVKKYFHALGDGPMIE